MRVLAITAVAGLVLLAGCDNQTDASPPPTTEDALTTATVAPTTPDDADVTSEEPAAVEPTTEEPTTDEPDDDGPPEMPAEAQEQTEAGAEAFVRFWITNLNSVYAGDDPDRVLQFSRPECQSCSALVEGVPDNPDGEDTFAVMDTTNELIGGELARVETEVEVLRGAGQGDGVLVFDLSVDSGQWIVDSIRIQARP